MPAELMTTPQVAELLSLSVQTVQRAARENRIPGAAVKVGKYLRWRRALVEQWIEARGLYGARASGTTDAAA